MGHGQQGYGAGSYGQGQLFPNTNFGWNTSAFPARAFPVPPFNGNVNSTYQRGILNLRWDDPKILSANTPWCVLGVNVYRSDVGERGPFHRLNKLPIGGTFYQDFLDNVRIVNEVVPAFSFVYRGDAPREARWVFRTQYPIVKDFLGRFNYANAPRDVSVTIDGQPVIVHSVFGQSHEVELINEPQIDPVTRQTIPAVIPNDNSTVLITYTTNCNIVEYQLDRKITYRLTTVAELPEEPNVLYETPLRYSEPLSPYRAESLDYIWREAVRRNNWILEQGGERVAVFIRKTAGVPCSCKFDERSKAYQKQPKNSCTTCFGTGYIGGYEGPYEIITVPQNEPRTVNQTPWGRLVDQERDCWTGPTPWLTHRDFIVTQSNERYIIGGVTRHTSRGMFALQQHFSMSRLSEYDIRYDVPLPDASSLPWPESRLTIDPEECLTVFPLAEYGPMIFLDPCEHGPQVYPVAPRSAMPQATEKSNIDDTREHRGRTQTFENQQY